MTRSFYLLLLLVTALSFYFFLLDRSFGTEAHAKSNAKAAPAAPPPKSVPPPASTNKAGELRAPQGIVASPAELEKARQAPGERDAESLEPPGDFDNSPQPSYDD